MSDIRDRFVTSQTAQEPTGAMKFDAGMVREAVLDAAECIDDLIPNGRWKSLSLTALEEALMWANKAIFNEKRDDDE